MAVRVLAGSSRVSWRNGEVVVVASDGDETAEVAPKHGGWRGSQASLDALHHSRPGAGSPMMTHGLTKTAATMLMKCGRCAVRGDDCAEFDRTPGATCAIEEAYLARRLLELAGADGVDGTVDEALIHKTVWLEVLQGRGLRYIALTGGFRVTKGAVIAEPALGTLLQVFRAHQQALDSLGLTPVARAKLKLGAESPVAALYAAALHEAQKALPAVAEEVSSDADNG